jgi:hypothetical protein
LAKVAAYSNALNKVLRTALSKCTNGWPPWLKANAAPVAHNRASLPEFARIADAAPRPKQSSPHNAVMLAVLKATARNAVALAVLKVTAHNAVVLAALKVTARNAVTLAALKVTAHNAVVIAVRVDASG